jgi:hypothetical protein
VTRTRLISSSSSLPSRATSLTSVWVGTRHQRGKVSTGGCSQEGRQQRHDLAGSDLDSECAVAGELTGPQLGCARPQSPCRGGQTVQVMEHPRSRFGRAERIKRDYEREADSLVEGDPVGRVGCWTDRSTNRSSSQGPM